VIFGIEQNIKFFGQDLVVVAFHLPFGMVDGGNIRVRTEKVEDNPAEGDDIYGERGIFSSQGTDKRSEHYTVAVALSCKNNDAFGRFFRDGR